MIVVALALYCFSADRMSKRDLTLRTINKTSMSIGRFYRLNQRLPNGLEELDIPKPSLDSWGRPIMYTPIGTNAYLLKSYGKSGRADDSDGIGRIFDAGDVTTESSRPINK